jgi:NADH-quinone oxidoreductase subunit A
MTPVAAYLLLFVAVGIGFIFVHLMAGKFIRPNKPDAAKGTTYECGEPTIGSAWIQFDVRFYVVALLFVIFDVEVAFFFPWAVVFGRANDLMASKTETAEQYHQISDKTWEMIPPASQEEHATQHELLKTVTDDEISRYHELLKEKQAAGDVLPPAKSKEFDALKYKLGLATGSQEQARLFSWLALSEIAVFFGVLLVGFAYLWRRGDLAWVRSLAAERTSDETVSAPAPLRQAAEPAMAVHS